MKQKQNDMETLIKKLENEFKTYLNTEKIINNAREKSVIAIECDDYEEITNKESFINGLVEKQNSQIRIACASFDITVDEFLSLLEEYETNR